MLLVMKPAIKFSSKIDKKVLSELKQFAKESHQSISGLLTEAVKDYLGRVRVRPAFQDAAKEVVSKHEELLKRLAK